MKSKITIRLATLDKSNTRRRDVILTLDIARLAAMARRADVSIHKHSEGTAAEVDVCAPTDGAPRLDVDLADEEAGSTLAQIAYPAPKTPQPG